MTGPLEVFAAADTAAAGEAGPPAYRVRTAALGGGPVRTSAGLRLLPDEDLRAAASPGTLVVPGGHGTHPADPEVVARIAALAAGAGRVVSVCTGAFLLAAAGLLAGRRAASHWITLEHLPSFGAVPSTDRVVFDGKYATAAGVSAGIDLALHLAGRIAGDAVAEAIQLVVEYDPEPPYAVGSVSAASPELVGNLRASRLVVLPG